MEGKKVIVAFEGKKILRVWDEQAQLLESP